MGIPEFRHFETGRDREIPRLAQLLGGRGVILRFAAKQRRQRSNYSTKATVAGNGESNSAP
jgi:hypothetical protein